MTNISTFKKKWLLGGITFALLAFLVIITLFLPKTAKASNNYFDNFSFYKNSDDNCNYVSFHVKTTFTWTGGIWNFGEIRKNGTLIAFVNPQTTRTFNAGNTETFLIYGSRFGGSPDCYNTYTNENYITNIGYSPDYPTEPNPFTPNFTDDENYYFSEFPTLTITYPLDDYELTDNFYIQGTFTQPDPARYKAISAFGTTSETCSLSYNQMINDQLSGDISIYISGLSAGYYDFKIYFVNYNTDDFYLAKTISNIHIVNDLPYALPPTENQPPTTAPVIFYHLNPVSYYTQNSDYSTSTKLFDTLTGTFSPILLVIGSHLTDFSTKFSASSASSTGTQFGQSVLIVRSYIGSVNSFFGGLPVSQFFLFYLVALSLVIVLRLIKGLIGLFKV